MVMVAITVVIPFYRGIPQGISHMLLSESPPPHPVRPLAEQEGAIRAPIANRIPFSVKQGDVLIHLITC